VRLWLVRAWEYLRTSYWFIPVLMLAGTAGLAVLTLELDARFTPGELKLPWLYRGGVEGARMLLSTLAGAIITVTGVVFSVTLVALTLTSSQLGPRLLQRFRVDHGTQLTLGTMLATFAYCLVVLRVLPGGAARTEELPNLSISVGVALAAVSFLVLVFFIHHITTMIQADHIISGIEKDLARTIHRYYPERFGEPPPPEVKLDRDEVLRRFEDGAEVQAGYSGYIQAIDHEMLLELASRSDVVVRLLVRAGHFVVHGAEILRVWPPERCDEELSRNLARSVAISSTRTPTQDVAFSIHQMVEVALRALSPGINDSFTAITCVDYLGAALARCAGLPSPEPLHYDRAGRLRVVSRPETFDGLLGDAFNQVRQAATGNVAVSLRILEALFNIASQVDCTSMLEPVRQHAATVRRWALTFVREPSDTEALERLCARLAELADEKETRSTAPAER